jgi:Zn-dependent peptidase ImmA (M78 family)
MTFSEGMSDLAADCGKLLQKLATAYLEVERLLSDPLPVRPFPEYAIPKDAIESFAEDLALRIRGDTGLGLDPIPDIFHLVESWGFRVFARPIDAKVSGVFAFHPIIGPAVLLNSNHPVTRAASAVAHEFAHLLTSRTVPEVTWVDESGRKSIAERFAPLFAQAFLMPAPTVREQYARVKDLDGDFTMRGLLYLADWYHVSIEAMARRLEQLKLVRPGTAELLRSRGVANPGGARRQAQITGTIVGPIPRRLAYLLSVAQARGLLSEGEIARKVVIDRLELRRVLDDYSESEPS